MPSIVILGKGAAGLCLGISLLEKGEKNVLIVAGGVSASYVSAWNLMEKKPEEFEKAILETGNGRNNKAMVKAFTENVSDAYSFFEKHGIDFRKSNMGRIASGKMPGKTVVEKLEQEFLKKGGRIKTCTVTGMLLKKNRLVGIIADKEKIFGDVFALAFGGLGSLYQHSTYFTSNYCLLSLALEAGIEIKNLEFNMFQPFLIIDKRFPKAMFSGKILKEMKFVDEEGKEFLSDEIRQALAENNHHYIFDKMAREFYLQERKGKIFAELVDQNKMPENQEEFAHIFEGKSLEEMRKFEIATALHYSLGGIKVNAKGKTNLDNVFALGECATGLHGASRIGGTAILECVVFAKIAAKEIAEQDFEKTENPTGNEIDREDSFDKEVTIPAISKEEKEIFWQSLGPVKSRKRLEELAEKKAETACEKLLKKAAKASLETGNLGTNFVE